jgi:hypothetical protein
MKKNLLLMMLCVPVVLVAQNGNGVAVSGLAVDAGTVTFNVSWRNTNMPELWSDTVWVFVDYNDAGVMKRLPVIDATASAGTVTKIPDNDKGVWVEGNARTEGSFSATVKLLTAPAEVAGACAYASNYPPVGEYTPANKISFTGTPEYKIVLEEITSGSTHLAYSEGLFTIPAGHIIQSFTDATGAPGRLNCISPSAYTLSGADVCLGADVTLTLSGSESGWHYQLYKDHIPVGSEKEGTGSALVFNETSTAAGRFSYMVRTVDATGAQCEIAVSNVLAITINPVSAIYRNGGNASQTVHQNKAITAMTYTASNAATISMTGSFPEGVTGNVSGSSYTISGTPTIIGSFGYTLTPAVGSCSSTAVVGTLTVIDPTQPIAASTQTWTYGTLTWSDRVVATPVECEQIDAFTEYDVMVTEYRVNNGRVYYSSGCVIAAQTTLCPAPWRAPTADDLRIARAAGWETISTDWGWGGFGSSGDILGLGFTGYVYSTTRSNPGRCNWYLRWVIDGTFRLAEATGNHGLEFRCVKP